MMWIVANNKTKQKKNTETKTTLCIKTQQINNKIKEIHLMGLTRLETLFEF